MSEIENRPLRATAVRFVGSPALPLPLQAAGSARVQTIKAESEWKLKALLKTEKRWRRIHPNHSEVRRIVPASGGPAFYAVKVYRLRDKTPRWRLALGGLVLGAGALTGLGAMFWHARWVLLALAAGLAVVFAAIAMLMHFATGAGQGGGCRCPLCGLRFH